MLVAAVAFVGCDTTATRSRQLARVAKDWSMTIRASQVIPVYPLTEDVLPGDLFLVQTRIEDEVKMYESKGFLPLDNLIGRLQPTNYGAFYLHAYGIGDHEDTPYHWLFPTETMSNAPHAAFPNYGFSVKRGGGINVALPVHGVPVGVSLLGAQSAHGSIALSDAYTFGVDIATLETQVDRWANDHSAILTAYAPTTAQTNYIRVVNRVYLARAVNVSLFSDQAAGLSATGGSAKEVALPLASTNAADNYSNLVATLSQNLSASAVPGGALKLVSATSRSISMNETFPRPLVIGYLGVDLPIEPGGRLGPPVPTLARISGTRVARGKASVYAADQNSERLSAWLKGKPGNRKALSDWLTQNGYKPSLIPNITFGEEYKALRMAIVCHFTIP
jgi:hypothetical protein